MYPRNIGKHATDQISPLHEQGGSRRLQKLNCCGNDGSRQQYKTIQFQERRLSIPLPRNIGSVLRPLQAIFHAFTFASHTSNPSFFAVALALPQKPGPCSPNSHACAFVRVLWTLTTHRRFHFVVGGCCCTCAEYPETIRTLGDWRSTAYLKYNPVTPNMIYQAIRFSPQNYLLPHYVLEVWTILDGIYMRNNFVAIRGGGVIIDIKSFVTIIVWLL